MILNILLCMTFKFIDLFAGIGGFHQAMANLGGECVFASEIDKYAALTYEQNYGIKPFGDIRTIRAEDIPKHDVLCAGFPCQAFSCAGNQLGFDDETRGTLFFEIERILKHHHTKYIILENVKNLISHDHGKTWKVIQEHLHNLGYRLTEDPVILSPHHFGTPQLRERVIILGIYDPMHKNEPLHIDVSDTKTKNDNSIYSILSSEVDELYNISDYEQKVLTMWNEFYQGIDMDVIGFPIWFEWFDHEVSDDTKDWKKRIINKNHTLYNNNKDFIDKWMKKWNNLDWCLSSHKKFEWQAGNNIDSIWEGVIQFRPSGVRVKAPNCFPALVAIVQTPIIGRYRRRLTLREAARLQDFPDDFIICVQQGYKQFGNAVNVKVIEYCAKELFRYKV